MAIFVGEDTFKFVQEIFEYIYYTLFRVGSNSAAAAVATVAPAIAPWQRLYLYFIF